MIIYFVELILIYIGLKLKKSKRKNFFLLFFPFFYKKLIIIKKIHQEPLMIFLYDIQWMLYISFLQSPPMATSSFFCYIHLK